MEPGPVTLQSLGQGVTSVGLSAALVLFFVWQSWKREERTSVESQKREAQWEAREAKVVERLQTLEEFTRTTLIAISDKTSVALVQNTMVLRESSETSRACAEAIHGVAKDLKDHHHLAIEIARNMKLQD